jgi:sortase A
MSEETIVAAPPPASPPPARPARSAGDTVRLVLRGFGQTLITLGLVVLLFAVYEVWITNIFAHRAQQKVANALQNEWRNGIDPLGLPGNAISTIPPGTGIAVLYIPRLGADFHFAIVQGSAIPDDSQLEKGPAHYGDTALPGQVGNFAIAGHRVGKGEPFLNIDKLRSGDAVIVETKTWWYVYRVKGSPNGADPQTDTVDADGIPGREIVGTDGLAANGESVLNPVPDHPGATKPTEKLMTMTTCHPKFTASHRMILHASLDVKASVRNSASLAMPASVRALYDEVKA